MGVYYALVAGTLWGIGPLLLKRGMTLSNVRTATLIEQYVSVLFLLILAAARGELLFLDLSGRSFGAFVAAGAIGASVGRNQQGRVKGAGYVLVKGLLLSVRTC